MAGFADRVREKGVLGTIRAGGRYLRGYASRRSTYIWYELDLRAEREGLPELAEGMRLVRVSSEAERRIHEQLPPEGQDPRGGTFDDRVARGGVPWVVDAGGKAAFTCWTFLKEAPVGSLPSGWLPLPEGTACLEDSITSADFRGQGIAPRAWAALSGALRDEGFAYLVTKVEDVNQPSRKAVTKAGFREVATMEVSVNGPRERLRAAPIGDSASGPQLVRRLDGQGRWSMR